MNLMFSIIVVSLNPGEKLLETIKSIRHQSFCGYEILVKDGGSKDDSLQKLRCFLQEDEDFAEKVRIVERRDKSIYEGMNQAAEEARGDYLYFLNCGDYFAHENSLKEMAAGIKTEALSVENGQTMQMPLIFYGDIYDALRGQVVPSNPKIDGFACYRNVPCHQACIYHRSLFAERGYRTEYKVRGDYEHFLWSYFCKNAAPKYMPVTLASYEGGGFSETKENRIRSAKEHKAITELYMSKGQLFLYKAALLVTLAPLRTKMAESPVLAGVYNRVKRVLYRR